MNTISPIPSSSSSGDEKDEEDKTLNLLKVLSKTSPPPVPLLKESSPIQQAKRFNQKQAVTCLLSNVDSVE